MKSNINYKSKKAIIITIILVALIAITTIAVMLFVKGNDNAEAIDGNTVENTINNNTVENNSSKNDEENEQNNNDLNNADKENQENDINNQENTNNNENDNETQENENNNVNNNQENTNNNVNENNNQQNTNNNQGNIPNQEFVTERVEIIPERVIAENYYVSWKPTQFETLINGAISFEKADITAEKTVAKVTENGFETNPESVKVGEILQYTITLTNKNNKVNGIINVKDEIPEGTEFITATKQNLETIPAEYENLKEVKSLEWKNIKVEAGSKVELVVYVKVVSKIEEKETEKVQNIATIYEGTTEEEVPSPETKVANITANKTSKIIYNQEKPHEHIIENGKEPLHEQDIIEYTIKLTNVGEGAGTVKVSDTVPEGTTFIKDGVVTVVDQNGTKTFEISDLEEGINVTVPGKADETVGTATVTFRVIVNVLETETKVIRNEMAKVDNESTNTTEDIAEKLYVDFNVTKIWNDDNNKAKVRPENVEFVLVQDGQETDKKLTANEANGWKVVFENLNKYTAEGKEIVYTIKETTVEYYNTEYSEDHKTVTNTIDYLSIQTEKEITKIWNDDNNKIGIRPENVEFVLVQDGKETDKKLTANEATGWKVVFEDLNKYTAEGNEIVYTIKEIAVNHYNTEYSEDHKTVTNTIDYTSIKTEKQATKVWKNTESDAAKENAITSITMQLKANGEVIQEVAVTEKENWTHTFVGLKKYDENGNEIIYTIDETVTFEEDAQKLEKYNKVIEGNTITNTFDPSKVQDETVELTATKAWENTESDAAKDYAITSIILQVRVYGEEGTYALAAVKEITEKENWTHTFTGLKKYDVNGNEIKYVIDETVNEEDAEKLEKYDKVIEGNTITNTFNPNKVQDDKTEITVAKVWEDDNNKAGVRPENVEFVLVQDGQETDKKLTANEETGWKVVFEDLNKYTAEGKEIVYTVKEIAVEHYNTEYSENGQTITNVIDYTSIKTSKTITKIWEDDNNKAGVRPENVEFVLVQEGQETDKKLTANEANGWKVVFENLNKYTAEGKEIVYTIKEIAVNHYNTEYSEDHKTVTNTIDYLSIKTEKEITKIWNDDNNKIGIRPENVEFVLVQDGKETDKKLTANEVTGWKVVFEDLNKYTAEGNEIIYTIKEVAVEHYITEYSEDHKTVTNTIDYTSIKTEKQATKVWKNTESDAAKENAITSITMQLKANGEVIQEVAVTEKENWTHTFVGLKKYDENGNKIIYTIDETVTFEEDAEKLEKYNKVIDGNTITNTFDPSKVQDETIEITATKVWKNTESDAAKDYAITSIILQVRVYGEEGTYALAAVKEITEKENWTHTFTGLKKYDVNGNEIKYVIDETVNEEDTEKLEKYDKVVEGNTITNTFNPNKVQDKTEITVAKVWNDDNNKAGVRPENVEFVLVQDGQEKDKKLTANEETGWKVVFEDLNKYTAEGKEIVYTVKEIAVEHYNTEYSENGQTVTNVIDYTSIKTSKTITKIWEDNSNKYETRPQNVVLSFNGVNYTLTAENDENKETTNEWTLTINNLQKYDAQGNEIIYTVTEPTVPTGYTKTENGLTVTNTANVIVEKSAHKENEDGTIGNEVTNTDIFKANEVVYYKLTFKNAGNTVIENKTLTDTLPARLKLLAVAGTEITENNQTGTDSNGYTWQVSENNDGNIVVEWNISNIEAGESKELLIKAQIETEYKDLCQKNGNQTENTAKLNIGKDGITVNSVGTVYLNTAVLPELEELSQNADIEKMLKNNNTIVDMIEKGITRDAIKQSLQNSGITLESDEVILWYAIKNENNENHIYGEIRKILEIITINNAVYMDNKKQDEVEIKTEDIEIGQSGTVTVNVTSTTTATVSNPMDVVFVIDTSGSMQGTNATNMVNAVNKSIKTIMAKNADTRIGIVGFSGNSSQSISNSSTIIPLGKYATNTNYLRLQNNTIYSTVTNNSRSVTGGTNTGAGIKAGAEMLTSQATTTFTTTVNGVTVTGTRTPVLILVTDGEPTYYYGNESATGSRIGNGQNTDENYYYWTIRNAKYYKDAITTKYYAGTQKQAKVFTIGIGMSGELATTMLNPNKANVDSCNDNSSAYRPSEKKRLYNLLNSNGTPYAYSYADGSKTGELTESDIENFLTSSLNASVETMEVRAITIEESKARRINLENIDISKPFLLEIIEETPIKYTTLAEAQSAGYVKIDTETNMYYVDLSSITRETTININYWEEE